MKKNKKKLPKFWLGTRMPNSLGYQPNYGIGGYLYTSTPGAENVLTETNTIKSNIVPSTLNKAQTYGSTLASMWLNATTTLNTTAFKQAMNTPKFVQAVSADPVLGMKYAAELAGTKTTLNAAGKALGVVGAAYGLTDMGFLIANNQDHRTAGDMRNTLTTNTYTTDLGNKYTTHGGVDISSELDYARKQKLSKNLNFTTSAIGTGATIGSLFSPIGTAIGAGVGALVGLGANALGFGDTEEETRAAANRLTDVTSMEDKMSYSLALNKDAQQGFYGRTKSGSLGAEDGKRPVQSAKGPVNKKATARVSNGELIGNFEDGFVSRVPGIPNNKDTKLAALKPSDFVITNKYGLSDYAAATGDYVGALKAQDVLMSDKYMMNGRNTDLLFLAKCGKLPKYEYGTWGDYVLTAAPNLAALGAAWQQYNADKNMPVEAQRRYSDYSAARNEAYRMLGDQIDPRAYLTAIDQENSAAKYNIQRMPGAGFGGRMVMLDSANRSAMLQKAKQLQAIDQYNIGQRNAARQLLANIDQREEDINNQNFSDWATRYQAANAAKYNALAQDRKNLVAPLAAGVKDMLAMRLYGEANDIKKRMINIYEQQANLDLQRFLADQADKNKDKDSKSSNMEYLKLKPVDMMKVYKGLNNSKLYNTQGTENPFGTKPLTLPTMPYYYGAPRIPILFNPYFY